MKVLHVVKSLDRGGAEVLLVETGRVSRPRVQPSYAWFLQGSTAILDELRTVGDVTALGAASTATLPFSIPALSRLVRQTRPDVLHGHLPLAGVAARLVGADLGVPVVYTEHNIFGGYHPATQLAARATWRLQRAVIAVSAEVGRSLPTGMNDPAVTVVPNGVPVERFRAARRHRASVRAALGMADDDVVVVTVAVFRSAKRLERLVATAKAVESSTPTSKLRFILVGDGPLGPMVRADAAAVDAHRLRLTGARTDIAELLAAADIFLLTSDREGLPVAVLEAMAAGLPVVATAVGGIPEVVDGSCGVLIDPSLEPAAMTSALSSTLRALELDEDRRRVLGMAAQQRVEHRFGIERMAAAIHDVYVQALT